MIRTCTGTRAKDQVPSCQAAETVSSRCSTSLRWSTRKPAFVDLLPMYEFHSCQINKEILIRCLESLNIQTFQQDI
ncbi:hypothetical protein Y032_0387g472 [Ancylostoma ceylanicum]|nr:hypothetical protein Y032_0387g472 [Ancylostoma ceylanicum]